MRFMTASDAFLLYLDRADVPVLSDISEATLLKFFFMRLELLVSTPRLVYKEFQRPVPLM